MMGKKDNFSDQLPMFIMDILHYDIEPIDLLVKVLNTNDGIGWREFWSRDFTLEDVIPALQELVEKSFVSVLVQDPNKSAIIDSDIKDIRNLGLELEKYPHNKYWFRLTDKGREAWEKWEPPKLEGK